MNKKKRKRQEPPTNKDKNKSQYTGSYLDHVINGLYDVTGTDIKYVVEYNINIIRMKFIFSIMYKKNIVAYNTYVPSIIVMIDKDKQIIPFWNKKIEVISKHVFLPSDDTMKNTVHSPINTLSTTWFDHKNYNINKDNDKFHLTTNILNTGDLKKTKNIRVFLNEEQSLYMKQIIGTYRYYYNRGVSYINNFDKKTRKSYFYVYPNEKDDKKIKIEVECKDINYFSMQTMRKLIKSNPPNWLLPKFPSHLIDQAFSECAKGFNTCLAIYLKYGKEFELKFKSRKDIIQTINLEKNMIRNIKSKSIDIFPSLKVGKNYIFRKIKKCENIPDKFCDLSLSLHTVLKKYYLNLPFGVKPVNSSKKTICAIDQGVITPFVIYSMSNITEIGKDCYKKINKKCKEVDIIQSRLSKKEYYEYKNGQKIIYKVTSDRKRKLRQAMHRKIEKIKNMKNELHNKTIKYLTDTYKGIILPPFETQEFVGKLSSKVSRSMNNLSFFKFKTKLKYKAKEKGVNVYEFTEPYTSKTCGNCGELNYNLESSRNFSCNKCKLKIDRDINGARNIFLRNINFIIKKISFD